MAQIPILTSIPPKWSRPSNGRNFGPAWLQLCISSWKASGFRPISLNSAAEIEASGCCRSSFNAVPRARPSIADMIDAAKKSGSRIAGIVNADCTTIPFLDLSAALENLLDNGVVIVERLNISSTIYVLPGSIASGSMHSSSRSIHWRKSNGRKTGRSAGCGGITASRSHLPPPGRRYERCPLPA